MMTSNFLSLDRQAVRKLLGAADGDTALLYLYLQSGNPISDAARALRLPQNRVDAALNSLRQLALAAEPSPRLQLAPEKPSYTEQDVLREVRRGSEFSMLVQEVQRRLGRVLSTEELKILLSLTDYLALPLDVIALLVNYCMQRNRVRGVQRAPSMRTIEKEAYHWADNGIETLEDAAAYTQNQLYLQSQIGEIRKALQLENRRLTMAEERYVNSWLQMGFGKAEIHMAYERTCLNKGALVWAYMNRILESWHAQGLYTCAQIQAGDSGARRNAAAQPQQQSAVGKAAIARLLAEEQGE